jgi:hypothetical protein
MVSRQPTPRVWLLVLIRLCIIQLTYELFLLFPIFFFVFYFISILFLFFSSLLFRSLCAVRQSQASRSSLSCKWKSSFFSSAAAN